MSMDLENGIGITDEEIEYTDDELDEILGREHTDGPDLSDESERDGDDEGEDEDPEEEKKVSFSRKDKKPKKKKVKKPEEDIHEEEPEKARREEVFRQDKIILHEKSEQAPAEIPKPETQTYWDGTVPEPYRKDHQPKEVRESESQGFHKVQERETQSSNNVQESEPLSPKHVQETKQESAESIPEILQNAVNTINEQAQTAAPFSADHAYEDYSEQMGAISLRAARAEDDSTLSQGLKEFRNSETVFVAKALAKETGTASLYKEVVTQDSQTERACHYAQSLIKEGKLTAADLDSKEILARKLSGIKSDSTGTFTKGDASLIISKRYEIARKFGIRSELLSKKGQLSKSDIEWISSDRFFRSSSSPRFGRILEKYFATEDSPLVKGVKLADFRYEDAKKLRKQFMKSSESRKVHRDMLKDYEKRLYKREMRLRVYGRGVVAKKPVRLAGHMVTASMAANSDMGHFIHKTRLYLTSADIAKRALFLTGSYMKKHTFIGKATGKLAGAVKKRAANTKLAKAVKSAKETISYTAKETYKYTAKAAKRFLRVDDVKKRFYSLKKSVYNTKPAKFARKLTKKGVKGAKAVKSAYQKVMHVISTPVRALGKLTNFIRKVNVKLLGILGATVLTLFKLYNALLVIVMFLLSIDSLLAEAGQTGKKMANSYIDMVRSVINYEDYDDMADDIAWMRNRDRERYERAREIGEGEPQDPNVTNGETIDRYGSRDNPRGYTITLTDPHGIELPDGTTNARDIEALCIAMISNDLGMYKGYWRDKRMLDDLIADMYDLLAYDITVEESPVYFCSGGCVDFYYHCNSADDYNAYYDLWVNGASVYTELVPLLAEDDGCCERRVWDRYEHEYVWESYCPGDHTARVCFGHKDANINITLYGIEYAMAHNIYPRDWRSKSYAPMIKEFVERGAWGNEVFCEYARRYYSGDWKALYGVDLSGGIGFASADPLSDEEIQKILESLPEDLSGNRKEIIAFALSAVGRVPYQWGGKASGTGWSASFGSSTPEEKGRSNGLDCSGFVQWVYRSAIGRNIPGSTAGFGGYPRKSKENLKIGDLGFYKTPGSEDNHIGIYAGVDEYGNDTWIHCAGSTGSTIGTGNFKYYVSLL